MVMQFFQHRSLMGLVRMQPDFWIQISFKKQSKWCWGALWVWFSIFQDSNFNPIPSKLGRSFATMQTLEVLIAIFLIPSQWLLQTVTSKPAKVACSDMCKTFVSWKKKKKKVQQMISHLIIHSGVGKKKKKVKKKK